MTAAAMAQGQIFIGMASGVIRCHTLATQLPARAPMLSLQGHRKAVTCMTLSSDGHLLASGAEDGNLLLWNIKSGKMLRSLPHRGALVAALLVLAPRNLFPSVACKDNSAV
jgi:WD40 repeat protein